VFLSDMVLVQGKHMQKVSREGGSLLVSVMDLMPRAVKPGRSGNRDEVQLPHLRFRSLLELAEEDR
jgi:hypothetical protein